MDAVNFINSLELVFKDWGYLLVFATSFIESSPFGWATPGGIILSAGGFYAQSKTVSLFGILLSGFLGTWSMLILAYYLGHKSSHKLAKLLDQKKAEAAAKKLLTKHGALILTTNLTSNVTRFWISYVAGTQKINLKKFYAYSSLASATWVTLWTTIGFLAGGERADLERLLPRLGIFSWVLLLFALLSIYYSAKSEHEDISN